MDTATEDAERSPGGDVDREDEGSPPGETIADPETAFSRLGDETRLRTIRTLAHDGPQPFTALFEASAADTTAGFAYHLRQLSGHYVEKRGDDEPRYHLTAAGRAVARALDAGTYTDRVARGPEAIEGDCPICGAAALGAGLSDNRVSVACGDCGTALLALPFPPGGARDRTLPELLDAFDAYHRRRLSLVADGVCPDCAGPIRGEIEAAEVPGDTSEASADTPERGSSTQERPVVAADCGGCPFSVRAPVSLFVREHPVIVAFLDANETDAGPVWNLGDGWRETVLSTDPWAVRVSIHADGTVLDLLVGDGPTVIDASRSDGEAGTVAGDDPAATA